MKKLFLCALYMIVLATLGGCNDDDTDATNCNGNCFPNGVAAGDVDSSSVILWARAAFTGTVRFEYGRDQNFVLPPDGVKDKVVDDPNIPAKVDDITGLLPGTQYYYRACHGICPSAFAEESEARGTFRTPFADGNHHGLKFGVSSCWRGDMKPFVSIKNVPHEDLHFFVALGDTVYADSAQGSKRATNLPLFRNKHKLAYSQLNFPDDNMFALARASTAFYVDIDDHEVVDNFAGGAHPTTHSESVACLAGALAGKPDPRCLSICDPDKDPENNCGRPFINETDLYKDALQAWYEYNPIREELYGDTGDRLTAKKNKLYRYRTFGKDAAIFMLDTRSFRSEESSLLNDYNPTRTMLGKAQLGDLLSDLNDAEGNGITWKFVLVPEPIQTLGLAGADRFQGYAYERSIILDYIETNCIANVVFISGDIHANIVNNLTYRQGPLNLQYFSTSWDISTGPVAYSGTGTLISPSGPTGTRITYGGEGEPHVPLDLIFQLAMDTTLTLLNRPLTGFGPETFIPPRYNNKIALYPRRSCRDLM